MPQEVQERTTRTSKPTVAAVCCVAVVTAFAGGHALGNKTTHAESEQLHKEVAESERLQQRVEDLEEASDDLQDDLLMAELYRTGDLYRQAYDFELQKKGLDMFSDSGMLRFSVIEKNPPRDPLTLKLKANMDKAERDWSTFGNFVIEGEES